MCSYTCALPRMFGLLRVSVRQHVSVFMFVCVLASVCLCVHMLVVQRLPAASQRLTSNPLASLLSHSAPPEWSVMNDPEFTRKPHCAKVDQAQRCSCDAGFHMSGTSHSSICQGSILLFFSLRFLMLSEEFLLRSP